jgi:hypothetical protein
LTEAKIIETTIETVRKRSIPEGGFAMYDGESFRPDATAWAVMALEASGSGQHLINAACQRLARNQLSDGRITVFEGYPESYWPTSLALLAWKKVQGFESQAELATQFLLNTSGKHRSKQKDSVVAHDTSIKGWPWIEGTYSWIEPTAMAVLALRPYGFKKHARIREAVRMILDRQLPSGGWNYGNKIVFNKELKPIPEYTGIVLTALADLVEKRQIILSVEYLTNETQKLRTPLALAWSIFGVSAWSNQPTNFQEWIFESLNLQKKYGSYNTALLSQLSIAYFTGGDLIGFLNRKSL